MRNLLLAVFAIVFFHSSCTKISSTEIGSGLIPPVDNVNTFDTTLAVETSTSINTLDPLVYKSDDHMIGVLNDPIFGKTLASTFVEMKPTIYPYSFPITPAYRVADSAVLVLSFRGLYGDSTMTAPVQNWEVRELTQSYKGDSVYPVSVNPAAGGLLGTPTIDVRKLGDSVINRFEATRNQVRIKLSAAFAQRLIKTYDSSNAYKSDSAFREALKGFAIIPAPGTNGNTLVRVNLADTETKLALYYHRDSANIKSDTSVNYFRVSQVIGQQSFTANRITRDYSGTELAAAVNSPGNAAKVYAQTNPGTFITVAIPGLKNLSNRIIHRAELVAFQEDVDNDLLAGKLAPPRYLLLSRYDTVKKSIANIPNDYEVSQSGPNIESSGGYLLYQNLPGFIKQVAAYSFNLSRYVQGIVTRKDSSYTLRIYAPTNDSLSYTLPYPNNGLTTTYYLTTSSTNRMAEGRVRLGGGSHPNDIIRMRLRIIYSRL